LQYQSQMKCAHSWKNCILYGFNDRVLEWRRMWNIRQSQVSVVSYFSGACF